MKALFLAAFIAALLVSSSAMRVQSAERSFLKGVEDTEGNTGTGTGTTQNTRGRDTQNDVNPVQTEPLNDDKPVETDPENIKGGQEDTEDDPAKKEDEDVTDPEEEGGSSGNAKVEEGGSSGNAKVEDDTQTGDSEDSEECAFSKVQGSDFNQYVVAKDVLAKFAEEIGDGDQDVQKLIDDAGDVQDLCKLPEQEDTEPKEEDTEPKEEDTGNRAGTGQEQEDTGNRGKEDEGDQGTGNEVRFMQVRGLNPDSFIAKCKEEFCAAQNDEDKETVSSTEFKKWAVQIMNDVKALDSEGADLSKYSFTNGKLEDLKTIETCKDLFDKVAEDNKLDWKEFVTLSAALTKAVAERTKGKEPEEGTGNDKQNGQGNTEKGDPTEEQGQEPVEDTGDQEEENGKGTEQGKDLEEEPQEKLEDAEGGNTANQNQEGTGKGVGKNAGTGEEAQEDTLGDN